MIATLIFSAGWLAIGLALRYRIRQRMAQDRESRMMSTARGWVRQGGEWWK